MGHRSSGLVHVLRLLVPALVLCATGCAPMAPMLRAQYALTLPLVGAEPKLTHTVGVGAGALGTGPGVRWGGALDIRFRPAGEVTGGALGASAMQTVAGEDPRLPFLYNQLGVGLIGTSALSSQPESSTFDLLSPHLDVGMGVPVARGFAFSIGISLQYLWRLGGRSDTRNVLLGSLVVGAGFFDPHTAPKDNLLDFFFE